MPRTDVKPADVAWAVSFATVVVERLVCVPFPLGSHPLPDGAPEVDPTPGNGNPTCARIPWPADPTPAAGSQKRRGNRVVVSSKHSFLFGSEKIGALPTEQN